MKIHTEYLQKPVSQRGVYRVIEIMKKYLLADKELTP
jgi:hypothetical protein